MMNLRNIIIAVLVVTGTIAQAQTSYMFDNPENRAQFGARVGVDVTTAANGGGNYSSNIGLTAGAVYDIPLFMNLYFEPGLLFFYNSFGTSKWNSYLPDNPAYDPETGEPQMVDYQVDGNIRNIGFRIPLLIGYHFDVTEEIKVNVFTGPQLNLNLMARYIVENRGMLPQKELYKERDRSLFGTEGFKHMDLQWNFGAGVSYDVYYISLNGAWGLTAMKSATTVLPRQLKRNIFAITLGYWF